MGLTPVFNPTGKVNSRGSFCSFLHEELPDPDASWLELFGTWKAALKTANVPSQAISNITGDWYEWLVAIEAWNYSVHHPDQPVIFLIPNATSFDVSSLYKQNLHAQIADLRNKVSLASNAVTLVTSNPDFAIAKIEPRPSQLSEPICQVNAAEVSRLETIHQQYVYKCGFGDIKGYLSVKASLRPDRRLQLAHEGSLMKALYRHLQTREWNLHAPGVRYFGMSMKVGAADLVGLQTVATHSIITVQSTPERAVDHVFQVDSRNQAAQAIEQLIQQLPV